MAQTFSLSGVMEASQSASKALLQQLASLAVNTTGETALAAAAKPIEAQHNLSLAAVLKDAHDQVESTAANMEAYMEALLGVKKDGTPAEPKSSTALNVGGL